MSDEAMFNAIAQSQADFTNKQESMQNMYTSEVDMFNQKKQQIQKYNKDMTAAARGQLNNLIGSDFAEAGIYSVQAGKQLYGQYKTARQAREGTAGDEGASQTGYEVGTGGDVKLAPPSKEAVPEPESSGIASGTTEPKYVTSSAQTDTPRMTLKGGMEQQKIVYDPSRPGMLRKPLDEGGATFDPRDLGGRGSLNALEAQNKSLLEQSVPQRGRAYRAGADFDPDMIGTDQPPPLRRWAGTSEREAAEATDLSIRPSMVRPSISQLPVVEAPRLRTVGSGLASDAEIPIVPRGRAATLRAQYEKSGGISGYDPRSGGVRPRSKTASSGTQASPLEDIAAPSIAAPPAPAIAAPAPAIAAPPPPAPAIAAPEPEPVLAGPPAAAASVPAPTQPVQKSQPSGEPEPAPSSEGAPTTTPKPTEDPTDPVEDKPPVGDDVPKEGGGGGGFGDALGLAGLGYGIYEEAESSDSTTEKALNITGQVGAFAGIEAAEMLVPGAGPVLGALTAVGYGLYDIFSSKHQAEANPTAVKVPNMPVAPTMAFDSTPTLDSSSFRAPLGGIVQ